MKTQNNNQSNTDVQASVELLVNNNFSAIALGLLASLQINYCQNDGDSTFTSGKAVSINLGDKITNPEQLKDLIFGEDGQMLVQSQQGIHEFDLTKHKNNCLGELLLPFNIYSERVDNGYQIEVLLDGKENSGNNRVTAFYSDLHEGEVPESLFHAFMYLLALEPEQWKISIMVLLYQLGYELQGEQKLDSHGCMTLAAELFNHHMEKNNQAS